MQEYGLERTPSVNSCRGVIDLCILKFFTQFTVLHHFKCLFFKHKYLLEYCHETTPIQNLQIEGNLKYLKNSFLDH